MRLHAYVVYSLTYCLIRLLADSIYCLLASLRERPPGALPKSSVELLKYNFCRSVLAHSLIRMHAYVVHSRTYLLIRLLAASLCGYLRC